MEGNKLDKASLIRDARYYPQHLQRRHALYTELSQLILPFKKINKSLFHVYLVPLENPAVPDITYSCVDVNFLKMGKYRYVFLQMKARAIQDVSLTGKVDLHC